MIINSVIQEVFGFLIFFIALINSFETISYIYFNFHIGFIYIMNKIKMTK